MELRFGGDEPLASALEPQAGLRDLAPAQRDALRELAGDLGEPEQQAIGDYLLGRQSPGQAEGTWRLLDTSEQAAEWAAELRDALTQAGLADPPPLPTDDGALSPAQRALRRRSQRGPDGEPTLRERREERDRRRTARNAQQAAAELTSPYRSEAIEAHKEAEDRIERLCRGDDPQISRRDAIRASMP